MEELARVPVSAIAGEHRERPVPRPAIVVLENAIAATVVVAPKAAPPAITRGFQAVTDPLPGATMAFDPADASGAVGPQHVVGAFNNAVTVHDRAGNLLSLVSMGQFWHDNTLPDKFLYDPRVAYDAASDRWVIVMLGDDSFNQMNGVLNIALSASGNPAGGWRRFRVPVDQTGHLDGDITHLAITADKIAVTVRVFNGDVHTSTTVFSMPKSAAFAGPNLSIVGDQLSPSADLAPLSSDDTTLRIAEWQGDNNLRIFELLPTGQQTNSKQYTASYSTGATISCAQLGTTFSPQCDGVPLSGLTRDGATWIVQETGRHVALIWKIKASAATTYVIQDSANAILFPSLAVNRRGAALVGYVTMSASTYLSAAYSTIDPAGNISGPATLKSGEAPFRRERWGDSPQPLSIQPTI
jgi:hypothetical protein